MKIFNIMNPKLEDLPKEILFSDFIKDNWLNPNLDKYKLLSDLSNKNGKVILKELFTLLNINVDNNTLKQLWTISFEVRKKNKGYK